MLNIAIYIAIQVASGLIYALAGIVKDGPFFCWTSGGGQLFLFTGHLHHHGFRFLEKIKSPKVSESFDVKVVLMGSPVSGIQLWRGCKTESFEELV